MISLDEAAVVYNLIGFRKNTARHDENKTTNGDKKSQISICFYQIHTYRTKKPYI